MMNRMINGSGVDVCGNSWSNDASFFQRFNEI
jgi:hypothetical protein